MNNTRKGDTASFISTQKVGLVLCVIRAFYFLGYAAYDLYAADAHFSKEGAAIGPKVIAEHIKKVQAAATSSSLYGGERLNV